MSHTAEVYLVDGAGRLRAHFPFGTQAGPILATLRLAAASAPTAGAAAPTSPAGPTPAATAPPRGDRPDRRRGLVVGLGRWRQPRDPDAHRPERPAGRHERHGHRPGPHARRSRAGRTGAGGRGQAARRRRGLVRRVPRPPRAGLVEPVGLGPVRRHRRSPARARSSALEQGGSARLGVRGAGVRTPTLDDVGGVALRITTDPLPDLRLSRTSTADALAERPAVRPRSWIPRASG